MTPDLLSPKHRQALEEGSGISPEVIAERGYETIYGPKPLEAFGFSKAQRRAPGILICLWTPDGSPAGHQYKPDNPRMNKDGKPIKYETPAGASLRLDVPPRCRPMLGNPEVALIVTEGRRKLMPWPLMAYAQ